MGWFFRRRKADPPADRHRPLLQGTVSVAGREFTVREERRQGPRPQLFVLQAADDEAVSMHVRPLPGTTLTTLEEVTEHAADPALRWFRDTDGSRWEVRPVTVESGVTTVHAKFISWTHGAALEGPVGWAEPLGHLPDSALRDALHQLQNHAPEE